LLIVKSKLSTSTTVVFFDNIQKLNDAELFSFDTTAFAITASIVDSSCKPLGLFVNNGTEISKINYDTMGVGNFFMPENGILCYTLDNQFKIERSKTFHSNTNIKHAVQTGPLLIWNFKINPSFGVSSKNKNIRCGVGMFTKNGEEYIVFVKSIIPVNYFDFASLFQDEFQCNIALTMESGNNAAMTLPGLSTSIGIQNVICRYLKISFTD
jgi:uncharacterized protein YigE (DUF2233 family)